MSAALKIFIIYAREDKVYKDDLLKSLKLLQNQGLIEPWHDSDIKPGDEWDKEIKAHLRAADIILPIISFDFFNSDYIHRVEIVEAFERYDRGEAVIIPIIADSCPWTDYHRLPQLQALPADGKPIDDWADRKKAMTSIYDGVKGIIVGERDKAASRKRRKAALPYFDLGFKEPDLSKKIDYYSKAIELDPEFALAYNNRGYAKHHLSKHEEAIKDCDEAIELDPEFADAYLNRGFAKAFLDKYEESIKDCGEAIKLNRESVEAYNTRGFAKYHLGKCEEAIKDCDEAIRLNRESDNAYNIRGMAKYDLGKYEESIKDFDEAIRLNPDNALAYILRGCAKENLGLLEAAKKDKENGVNIIQITNPPKTTSKTSK